MKKLPSGYKDLLSTGLAKLIKHKVEPKELVEIVADSNKVTSRIVPGMRTDEIVAIVLAVTNKRSRIDFYLKAVSFVAGGGLSGGLITTYWPF